MRKFLCLLISLALFAGCEEKTDTVAPAPPPEHKSENNTSAAAGPRSSAAQVPTVLVLPDAKPRSHTLTVAPNTANIFRLPSFTQSVDLLPSPSPDLRTHLLPDQELTITDKTNDITVEETLTPANIAFNTPKSMAYAERTSVELVLDLTKSASELAGMIKGEGPVETDHVNISHVVEARLTGDAFDITAVSDAEQFILAKTVTKWTWDVRPKRFSTQVLHLSLTSKLDVNGKQQNHSFSVFDRDIVVRIGGFGSAVSAAKDNWPIVTAVATPLLGLLGWLAKRIKKRGPTN
jgi:hypothetical protein